MANLIVAQLLFLESENPEKVIHLYINSPGGASYSTNGSGQGESYLPTYEFRENNVVLRPTPTFSETSGLRLEYISFPATLINGGDILTASVSPVFRDLIIMATVYKAKLQESLVTGVQTHAVAAQELSALYTQFRDAIFLRSKAPQFTEVYSPEDEG